MEFVGGGTSPPSKACSVVHRQPGHKSAAVLREPFDVPEVGRIAIVKQPGGGVIGWITPVPT